jgi:hypothetical protein
MRIIGNSIQYTQQVCIAVLSINFEARGNLDNNLSQRTVCKMHKWMAYKVDPLSIPSDSIVTFLSYILFY